ncbi:LCP family protein [Actinophytocola sp.]|uniref:LCP family protein n=1 Tax=Actinophytocola sp. TaxID=1872138 RepID=UPI002ED09B88
MPGRGRQQPSRSGGRTPPPANAGRVVGGRQSTPADRRGTRSDHYQDRRREDRQDRDRTDRDRRDRPVRSAAPDRSARSASSDRSARSDRAARPAGRPQRTSDARWQPLPDDPKPRSSRRPSRPGLLGGKVIAGLLSLLVLVGTGYYSNRLDNFNDSLTTADVIDAPPVEKPADGAIDILMVGMDSRTDAQGNPLSKEQLAMLSAGVADGEQNTDTLIMIRIPNDGAPAVGVSMPRDSYVEIPGYGQHKINSAYARAKIDARAQLEEEGVSNPAELQVKSNAVGAKKLIDTVQDLTGATIDHYAEVNLLGFYDITNAIGGIDVCLNAPVRDKYSGANFPAGPQTLAGTQALAFVRQRHGLTNGDLDRIKRQQVFMSGMAKKIMSGNMLAPGSETLDKLQAAIQKSVVLDKGWNVLQFATQMTTITGGNVDFQTIPTGSIDLKTESDGSAVEVDPDDVKAFVAGLLGTKTGTSESGAPDAAADNSKITVNVYNATDRKGLATGVAKVLTGEGFVEGAVDNADARSSTVVRHATGEQDFGTRVGSALGGNVQVEEDANLPAGSVSVLLGEDYDGPGGSASDSADGNRLTGEPMLNLTGPQAARAQPLQPGQPGCVN